MNSYDVYQILEQIAATGVKAEKEELMGKIVAHAFGKKVIDLACNSFITFGIKPGKVKTIGSADFDIDSEGVFKLFDMLASRELTGNAAKNAVENLMKEHSPASAELIWRILNKDLRCGATANTVNRVLPGTIPTFDVMLAHKFEERHVKNWPVAVEPKLDGVRVICLVKDGKAQFYSRTGKPFPAVEHLGDAVTDMVTRWAEAKIPSHVKVMRVAFDGEIVSGSFNKTVGDVRRKDEAATDAEYHIFDTMPYDGFTDDATAVIDSSYLRRRDILGGFLAYNQSPAIKQTPVRMASNADECQQHYQDFRAMGLEGAIVKPLEGKYEKKRSRNWLKLKNEATEDLVIVGAFEGTGKYEGSLGGLIVDRNGIEVRVGGGFSDVQRAEFWNTYQRDTSLTTNDQELIGRMIEVEYHEVTPDGSLRHPRFVRFRDDKHDPQQKEAA